MRIVRSLLLILLLCAVLAACIEAPATPTPEEIAATAASGPTATEISAATGSPPFTATPEATTPPPSPTATPSGTPTVTATATPTLTPTPAMVEFAVIGDFGFESQPAADVATLVHSWEPDFIVTTGDNNYPSGSAETIDAHIGQYYADYIYPYSGTYTVTSSIEMNRFFPTLGNHDYLTDDGQPYLDYFTLPGNERYYDVVWEPVHLFAVNSNWLEPDGIRANSEQAAWLQEQLATSTLPWKVVAMHVPPYSSGQHGSSPVFQWPFAEWGASVVLAGHNHVYERLLIDEFPYFVNGLGGYPAIYQFVDIVPGSQVRYRGDFGAMRVQASETEMTLEFITRTGEVIDSYTLRKDAD